MNKKIYILLAVVSAVFTACGDDESLSPYEYDEPVWTEASLPQGDHDYDDVIMEWHRKYNVIPLYIFGERDYYWKVTSDIRWYYDSGKDQTMGGYKVIPADQDYVGQLLELVEQKVFRHIPDATLAELLPYKILLAQQVIHNPGSLVGEVPESQYTSVNCLSGFDYVCFAGAIPEIENFSGTERDKYQKDCVKMIMEKGIDNGKLRADELFYTVSDYDGTYSSSSCLAAGLLNEYVSNGDYDLKTYVNLITSTPYEQIKSRYLDRYSAIKDKYEMVVNSFKEKYNIDLQNIGNDVEK